MPDKLVICKANSLTYASFTLTLNEKRLLLACIGKIKDPRIELSRDDEFTISAPYFSTLFNISLKNAYAQLSDAASALVERVAVIECPDAKNKKLTRRKVPWLTKADYYDGDGKVVLQFNEQMIPYISNLQKGCFTQYGIDQVVKLKSVHAIRLYELLACNAWKNQDYEVHIDDLRFILDLINEYEKVFDLKRCVIDPSIKSINEHTNCKVSYQQKKTGKAVTHLVFTYSIDDSSHKLQLKPKRLTDDVVQKYARPGESWAEARSRISKIKDILK